MICKSIKKTYFIVKVEGLNLGSLAPPPVIKTITSGTAVGFNTPTTPVAVGFNTPTPTLEKQVFEKESIQSSYLFVFLLTFYFWGQNDWSWCQISTLLNLMISKRNQIIP